MKIKTKNPLTSPVIVLGEFLFYLFIFYLYLIRYLSLNSQMLTGSNTKVAFYRFAYPTSSPTTVCVKSKHVTVMVKLLGKTH